MFSLLKQQNIYKELTWIPAHVGTEGNKTVDALAKQALKMKCMFHSIDQIQIINKDSMNKIGQEVWQKEDKGRHLCII